MVKEGGGVPELYPRLDDLSLEQISSEILSRNSSIDSIDELILQESFHGEFSRFLLRNPFGLLPGFLQDNFRHSS